MIILVASALSTVVWVMQAQGRVSNEITLKTNEYLNRMSEKIEISKVTIKNSKFNITLANEGGSATVVKAVYIVNETASPTQQYRYDVHYLVDGRSVTTNLGQSLAFTAKSDTAYSIKVITDSGNSAVKTYLPTSTTALPLSLSLIPSTITTGENITLLYTIANNSTGTEPVTVTPTITRTVTCAAGQTCTATKVVSGPSSVVIERGSFAVVKEIYKVDGPPNTQVTFNASYTGANAGNYVTERGNVIVVSLSQGLTSGIATKPEIFLLLPGPFGDSDTQCDGVNPNNGNCNERGLWGTVVVNPTTSTMRVSRVIMTAFTASHTGDTVMITGCAKTAIYPTTSSEWTCPHNNQIQWKDLAAPEVLAPGQSVTFLVRVAPADLSISEEPGATVTATVYTDIGIFTKAGYTTSMRNSVAPLGAVYLTDTTNTGTGSGGALNNINMFGHQNNIPPGVTRTFYVAIADLDADSGTEILDNSRLIINVPPGFSNVAVTSDTGFNNNPSVTLRADGITQIIGILNGDLGNSSSGEVEVIRFTATTPSPTVDTTYIMFAFADGLTNGSPQVSVGALAQIALEVDVP
jgi:hypothetical protein